MAILREHITKTNKHYDILMGDMEKKVLSMAKLLKIDSFSYDGKHKYKVIYYDTSENLLARAGILMYKTWEDGEYFIKIERLSILASTSRLKRNETFSHKIEPKDGPQAHSFYLLNGITNMFSTQFSIDIEHVIKNVEEKIEIEIERSSYKAFAGTGFKCGLNFESCEYYNRTTKRRRQNKELILSFDMTENFLPEFENFASLLEKYCKELIPKTESRFSYASRITKPLVKEEKLDRKAKKELKQKEKEKRKKENRII